MPRRSAGLLVFRRRPPGATGIEVLLVHPGGPWWSRKDAGAWSIPKGEVEPGEEPALVAEREFREELGQAAPGGVRRSIGEVRQSGGKMVVAWAVHGDLDVTTVESNTFEMEWPPRSGRMSTFPEVDRAGWFSLPAAATKILAAQRPFLDRLAGQLESSGDL